VEDQAKVVDAPVRVVCRYSNGIMESTVARGIMMKGNVLRVLCRTSFDPGIQVTVMAGFLARTSPAQIAAVTRGKEPGTYVVDLRLRPTAMSVVSGPVKMEPETPPATRLKEAARTLAARLDSAGWVPFYGAAFERATPSERPAMLAATEVAVYTLLEERGLTSVRVLLNRIGKGSR
jgi:hypothetical protein